MMSTILYKITRFVSDLGIYHECLYEKVINAGSVSGQCYVSAQ